MPDNSTEVKVGRLIAILVEKGDDWKNVEIPKTEEKAAEQKSAANKPAEIKGKEEKPKSDLQEVVQSQYVFCDSNNFSLLCLFIYQVTLLVQSHGLY